MGNCPAIITKGQLLNTIHFLVVCEKGDQLVSQIKMLFYYRIYSLVILIEFDHQGPVGIKGQGREATRNHIHSIVRTPNGNDYGKDLLRQHLLKHHSQK